MYPQGMAGGTVDGREEVGEGGGVSSPRRSTRGGGGDREVNQIVAQPLSAAEAGQTTAQETVEQSGAVDPSAHETESVPAVAQALATGA